RDSFPTRRSAVLQAIVESEVLVRSVVIGVAHNIQPVASPPFPKLPRSQQPVHHALDGSRRVVAWKGVHVVGRWRQSGKVEGQAAQQDSFVRIARWRQAFLLEFGEDETVD